MTLANLLRKATSKLGIRRRSDWEIRVARDEALIRDLLLKRLREDSNCVDVGANIGDFLTLFTNFAPAGQHIAVEPIPKHAADLAQRFSQVRVFECALSDREGEATFFHVAQRDAWSGLQKQRYPNGAIPQEITVQLKRLDDVAKELDVDFIKIDVEGAEYEVLQGARDTLMRCRPTVLFEHARLHNENYGTTPDMIFDFFQGCGMAIHDLSLSRHFDRRAFRDIYEQSFATNYNREAQTNFVALYVE